MCDRLSVTLCVEWESDLLALSYLYLAARLTKFSVTDWDGRGGDYRGKWYMGLVPDSNIDVIKGWHTTSASLLLYFFLLYCTLLYCTFLYCTFLQLNVLFLLYCTTFFVLFCSVDFVDIESKGRRSEAYSRNHGRHYRFNTLRLTLM